MPMGKRASAELLGPSWLVFGSCDGAVLSAAFPNAGIGLPGVSIAFRLTAHHALCDWAHFRLPSEPRREPRGSLSVSVFP